MTNIKTFVDKWAESEPGVDLIYGYYCELVHPNLGSTFLVMGNGGSPIAVGGKNTKTLGRKVAIDGLSLLSPIIKEAGKNLAALGASELR
jgi:hypothetical protein